MNRCECGGTFHGISLTMEERIQRRLGRHWVQQCDRCGTEVVVETPKQKKKLAKITRQPTLFRL